MRIRRRAERRRDPPDMGQVGCDSRHRRGLHNILQGDEVAERSTGDTRKGAEAGTCQRSRHIEEAVDLLPLQRQKRAPGDLGEQHNGHPLRCRPQPLPGHQAQIDGTRQHNQADEECPEHDFARKTLFKLDFLSVLVAGSVFGPLTRRFNVVFCQAGVSPC